MQAGSYFFQHDVVAVDEDFDRIFMTNVECSAKFDGKNNSSEFIDLSHDSVAFIEYLLF